MKTHNSTVTSSHDEPERPSHFEEDINVYATYENTQQDYPSEGAPVPHYGWQAPPPDPIPVYLVEAPPRDRVLTKWAAVSSTAVPAVGQRVGAKDRMRTRMYVYNTDAANSLIIVGSSTDIAASGLALPAGKTVEFFHNQEVWVLAPTGLTTTYTAFWEYQIEENGQ